MKRKKAKHYATRCAYYTKCGLTVPGPDDTFFTYDIKTTDHWDRVTCKNCLSARRRREARKGFTQLQKMYREFVNYVDEFQLKPGEVIR